MKAYVVESAGGPFREVEIPTPQPANDQVLVKIRASGVNPLDTKIRAGEGEHSQSGGQFFGIHASNGGKIMIFAGGIPLKRNGKVVGAIGVSGGSGEQDHAVAEAGAAADRP
jgi:uncharacterized protein GlcG (DUF336 family)